MNSLYDQSMPTFFQRVRSALRLIEPGSQEAQNGQPQRVIIHTEPTGSSGTEIYSGYYSEEYLQTLRGTQAADIWDQVRRSDAKIRMCLKAVKAPILGAQWTVRAASQEEKHQKQAELVEHILFNGLPQSFTQQLQEILTFLDFGFSIFEVLHGIEIGHPKFGNFNTIKKMAWRSPRTIERWNLQPQTGKLLSVSQYAYGDLQKTVDIPGEFLVVFTNEKEGDNYEGISALRACYGPWKRKNTYQKLMAIGMEKYAVPTPKMKVPAGKENSKEYSNAKLVLEKFVSHQQQYVLYPEGWDLDFASSTNFDAQKIQDAIVRENAEIASAFMVNFLELGQQQSGSWALSNDLSDFALLSIQYVADYICEILNGTVVKQIIDMNYGKQDEYPTLVCSGIKDKPGKEYAEIIKLLVDGKVVTPDPELEEELREKYGLPEMPEPELVAQLQAQVIAPPAGPTQKLSLTEGMDFALLQIDVSKKIASTQTEAERLAQEITSLGQTVQRSENEFEYRFTLLDPGSLVEGSLKSFEPMEGMKVLYGKLKVESSPTPVN